VADDFSPVLANDAIANAETQASALADILGGEKGIENAIGIGDPDAIVAE